MSPWCTHMCKDGMFCLLDASLILQKVDAVFPFVAKALQMCIHFCFLEFGCKCIRANFLQARQWSSLNFENVKEKSFFHQVITKKCANQKKLWMSNLRKQLKTERPAFFVCDQWKIIWCQTYFITTKRGIKHRNKTLSWKWGRSKGSRFSDGGDILGLL